MAAAGCLLHGPMARKPSHKACDPWCGRRITSSHRALSPAFCEQFDRRWPAHHVKLCAVVRSRSLAAFSQLSCASATIARASSNIKPHRGSPTASLSHGRRKHQGPHCRPQPRGGPRASPGHEARIQLRCRRQQETCPSPASAECAPACVPAPADGEQPPDPEQCAYHSEAHWQPALGRRQPQSASITCAATPPTTA